MNDGLREMIGIGFPRQGLSGRRRFLLWGLALLFMSLTFYFLFVRPPAAFPAGRVFKVKSGTNLLEISRSLKNENFISSPFWFRQAVELFGGERRIMAGDYLFDKGAGTLVVAYRLIHGERGYAAVRVVLPEGSSVKEMAKILAAQLKDFDAAAFVRLANKKEGYLFPDTYLFPPDAKQEAVIATLSANFDKKTAVLRQGLGSFGKPLADVIRMASFVEEEGRTHITRRTIAGILWKRLAEGIPLQVDACFLYINGKRTDQLTTDDLKIDSPYNTYLYKGLPPTPITNPGLDAIEATLTPIQTEFFFYLTDDNGGIHYAVTHEEHLANKERYLR